MQSITYRVIDMGKYSFSQVQSQVNLLKHQGRGLIDCAFLLSGF
jgi:hypothetical protein